MEDTMELTQFKPLNNITINSFTAKKFHQLELITPKGEEITLTPHDAYTLGTLLTHITTNTDTSIEA